MRFDSGGLGRAVLGRAVLAAGLLAAAAGCTSSPDDPQGAGGTSSGAAPSTRTLSPAPSGGSHPAAAWPTFGRDFARSGVAAGVAAPGGPGALKVGWRAHLDGAAHNPGTESHPHLPSLPRPCRPAGQGSLS